MNDLVQALVPGGRLVWMERLRGGIGARMHSLTIEAPGGGRQRFVLRRTIRPTGVHSDVEKLFRNLTLLDAAGIPTAKPVLLDAAGAYFGKPAVVMTRLPGKVLVRPKDEPGWIRQLADALAAVHRVTPDTHDLSHLSVNLKDGMREKVELPSQLKRSALGKEIYATLVGRLDDVEDLPPVLVHDDYWPGNTVWYRGKLSGIVDWSTMEVGDRRADVAQCRIDLLFIRDAAAADAFRDAYEASTGEALPDLWYWDLYRGIRALAWYDRWLVGYLDLGLSELTPAKMRRLIGQFLEQALEEGRRR